jgi:transaldolase
MEILFDTANLSDIGEMTPLYPVSGVTTNPTIIKAEGRIDFYKHMRRIREIIGPNRTLHIQVLAQNLRAGTDQAARSKAPRHLCLRSAR